MCLPALLPSTNTSKTAQLVQQLIDNQSIRRFTRFVGVGDSKFSTLPKLEECCGYDAVEDSLTFGIKIRVDPIAPDGGRIDWMDNPLSDEAD